jgi:hypothetical protein
MARIKKVLITEFGDEDKLDIVEDEIPEPAVGQVASSGISASKCYQAATMRGPL